MGSEEGLGFRRLDSISSLSTLHSPLSTSEVATGHLTSFPEFS